MKKKNEQIRKAILEAAKLEFLEKGFKQASMRGIAARSRVTLSNVYTYFKDKNALLEMVLEPQLNAIYQLEQWATRYRPATGPFDTMEVSREQRRMAIQYIHDNRDELHLLFNRSQGSSLENFPEWIADRYQKNWGLYFDDLEKNYPGKFKKPSSMFIHSFFHFYLKTISEALDHNLTMEEMLDISEEMLQFSYHGIMALVDQN